jgi:putative protease
MSNTELLLPAGNVEAFYAAVKGGADAVYVGLKQFNARGRASNFSNYQFLALLEEARKNKVKVYVTLNTVIKNKELPELLEALNFLSKAQPDAVIIQDWGTLHLIKKLFPKLTVHASTQMANHNSAGANYSQKLGIERVILARELTFSELEILQKKTTLETEIFVHGALCYSFSGMCMFSSYLGGMGANRGLCTQPCRRYYKVEKNKELVFSLKDNQLIELIPDINKLGVASLKIEGRLKSGEYVHNVAKAYRMVIDNPTMLPEARQLLAMDMGRDKTQWFYGNELKIAISDNPNTGLPLGKVLKVEGNTIQLKPQVELEQGNRLRIRCKKDNEQHSFKIEDISKSDDGFVSIVTDTKLLSKGDPVFLAGLRNVKFPNKFKNSPKNIRAELPHGKKQGMLKPMLFSRKPSKNEVMVRIDSLDWLRKLRLETFDQLIINLSLPQWALFRPEVPFLKKNAQKIWVELPAFISEKSLGDYKQLLSRLMSKGYKQFVLSHLSQKELLPKGAKFACNENVYVYNDAAAKLLLQEGAQWYMSPFENEFENMLSGSDRNAVVPVHYFPRLFFSRQPVLQGQEAFLDDTQKGFKKLIRSGITIVIPDKPVSLLQYRNKLSGKGFNRYFIDLSFEKPSKHTLNRLLLKLKKSEQEQPSTTFNFKKGLK